MNTSKPTPSDVTSTILESISDGVFTVDHEWRIMSFNRAAEQILGISREDAIGKHCWEVFRSNMCHKDCALKRTMKVGKSFIHSSTHITGTNETKIPITVSTSVLKNSEGEILGGVETFRDHSLVEELKQEISGKYQLGSMVSRSKVMLDLFKILEQVAKSESTILIEGETGTGKEVLAKTIHNLSLRHKESFVGLNCGALPDSLLESELFGYKAGAFTDARTDKRGLFEAAGTGTILLDEIGDTSSAFQIHLLRVLEEKEFQPLGSTKKVKTNARILAATNRTLEEMVQTGEFRQDLFYRLNIITLRLPPLRERLEDIPLLVERFMAKMNTLKDRSIQSIDSEAMVLLLGHDYPGNIRELENIIEHAFVLCDDEVISSCHLPANLRERTTTTKNHINFADAEKDTILSALEKNGYNRQKTAHYLGIHKTTLFRKIKKLGLQLPAANS